MTGINDHEFFYSSFDIAVKRSKELASDLHIHPHKHSVLTGDRPTGNLYIGHCFGSLQNRIRLQELGIETYILIADYQVLTDRVVIKDISKNVIELTLDYLACGLGPLKNHTHIFPHNHILEKDKTFVREILRKGIHQAREVAIETLTEVRKAMDMEIQEH